MAYKTLDKLISEVQDQIKKLEYGQLNIQELDELVDYSKELHERLIVLRYKAYDHKIKSKEKMEGEIPLLFKMESNQEVKPIIPPNQTSLIDAIDDVISKDVEEEVPVQEEKKHEVTPEVIPEVVNEQKAEEEKLPEESPAKQPEKKESPKTEDLAGSLFDQDDNSLVSQHTKSPISSLKKVITLNQKFRFISALFGGDADEYNATIKLLDDLSTFEEANTYLNENVRNKYELEGDEEEVEIFMDLVQRRYL